MEQNDTKRTGTDAGCPLGGETVYIMLGELRSERDEDEHGQQRHVLGMNDVSSSEASNLDQLWLCNHTSQHGLGCASDNLRRVSLSSVM